MLRTLVAKILWILIFGLGQANDSFPPCIRINADLYEQDMVIDGYIKQSFIIFEQDAQSPKYISNDGKHVLRYNNENTFKWRLIPKGSPNNKYLKAPAPINAEGISIKDPLLIEDDKWQVYTDSDWHEVTNPVKVIEDNDCPQSSEQNPDQSNQESDSPEQVSNEQQPVSNQQQQISNQPEQVSNEQQEVSSQQPQVSNYLTVIPMPTTRSSTTTRTTSAPMTIPDCIRIKTDLSFIENNNDVQVKIESLLKVLKVFEVH